MLKSKEPAAAAPAEQAVGVPETQAYDHGSIGVPGSDVGAPFVWEPWSQEQREAGHNALSLREHIAAEYAVGAAGPPCDLIEIRSMRKKTEGDMIKITAYTARFSEMVNRQAQSLPAEIVNQPDGQIPPELFAAYWNGFFLQPCWTLS